MFHVSTFTQCKGVAVRYIIIYKHGDPPGSVIGPLLFILIFSCHREQTVTIYSHVKKLFPIAFHGFLYKGIVKKYFFFTKNNAKMETQ